MALKYAQISVELREVILRDKPAEMLAISPKGTVPVLQLPDGTVIDESLDIMRWALVQHDPQAWASSQDEALILVNDGPFKQLLDRYKYADRYPERAAGDYRDEAVQIHLAPLEARLQRTDFLSGDQPSLADTAIFPFIRQFAEVDRTWFDDTPLPALQAWLNWHLESPLFQSVMEKYPAWSPEHLPITF